MLLKAIRAGQPMPERGAARALMTHSFVSQCLSDFLARLPRIDPHPWVLDLGVLCGANIAFLGARGCRVSVESLPYPQAPSHAGPGEAPAAPAASQPRSPLSYPGETFSGILAWDAISRLAFPEATAFVETLRRLLMEGGVVLSYFPGPPAAPSEMSSKYRIVDEDHLQVEPAQARRPLQGAFQNREIYGLFSRFDVIRLSHLKSGTREILVARSRRAHRA